MWGSANEFLRIFGLFRIGPDHDRALRVGDDCSAVQHQAAGKAKHVQHGEQSRVVIDA